MPIFDEDDKGTNNMDGFPDFSVTRGYAKKEEKKEKIPSFIKKIPLLSLVLIILMVLLGGAVAFLAAKMAALNTELNEVKGIRGQLSTMQTGFDSAVEGMNKERNRLKTEVSQLRNEIDAMKAQQRRQAEVARERQTAAEAKKKAAPAKKTPPKR
ncbi:MAG TPA: hypothetical protein VGJ94_08240 [Syntrophorhabdaceae bacterium]|jgi:uncharacterized protein YlxW (UPF0749 family)